MVSDKSALCNTNTAENFKTEKIGFSADAALQPVHLTPYSDLKMLTLIPAASQSGAKPHITCRRLPSVKANKTIPFTKSRGATLWFLKWTPVCSSYALQITDNENIP